MGPLHRVQTGTRTGPQRRDGAVTSYFHMGLMKQEYPASFMFDEVCEYHFLHLEK